MLLGFVVGRWGIGDESSSRAGTAFFPTRNPKSAIPFPLLPAACPPMPPRPDFRPDPRALTVVLDARPERVTTVLDSLVAAESLEVARANVRDRSEEHTSELQSQSNLVCRLLLEKKKKKKKHRTHAPPPRCRCMP